jgi:outer membrane receptor protein involved in Fe transport
MKQPLLLFFLLISINLFAQQTADKLLVKGIVIDSVTNKPLDYTTVALTDLKTSQAIKSMLTKTDGTFEFTPPANGHYVIALVYIGYRSKLIPLSVPAGNTLIYLGKILMQPASGELKEVAIVGAKPLLKREIDRVSFDVQADPESKANDALEMLRKVPMITVDANEVIQLKGSDNYQIFINGKPSALMSNSPSDVLKSMPAATIKRVEVITVPPSKYDGEGLVGIINIITLEKSDAGINGTAFARINDVMGERGSISLAAKKDKFNLNLFLGAGHIKLNNTAGGSDLTTFSPATNLSQQGRNINAGNVNNGRTEITYEVDTLHLLTATADFVNRRFTPVTTRNSQLFALPDSLKQSYQLNNTGVNSIGAFDLGANYQLGFKKNKDELLTLSYQYSYSSRDQDNDIATTGRFNYDKNDYNQQNNTVSKEHTFQLDFLKPLNKLTIEAGAKAILRINSSDFEEEDLDPASGQYIANDTLTDHFTYHQNVYSVYNSYQLKLTDWIVKGGLRAENTVISGNFAAAGALANQNYLNFTPAISIQRNYKNSQSITFGYTERVERPSISQLNPFVDRSDPEFILTGNPNLRPVVNHIAELGFSKFGKLSLNASLNYAFANNTIQNVTSLISDTVSKSTYLNVGKNESAGINLSISYPFTDKLNFNMNTQLAHVWITGTYNSEFYRNNGSQGNFSANLGYKFAAGFTTGLNLNYMSGNVYLQGKSSDFVYTSVVIIKDFLNKKVTISLTVNNPYQKYNTYSSYTNTPDFQQSAYSQQYYRNFRLAFNYKFGSVKGEVKTTKRGIKNDDVKSNSSGNEN